MDCLLVTVLLLGTVFGNEIPSSNYLTKQADCPQVGYFYHREVLPNRPDACHLCLCRQNSSAACWQKDIAHCDVNLPQERSSRKRRSPVGLSDIIFRDATRDFFNKQLPEQCKPFEGSFSEGCPPADWCIGCTVCDCDANGRWDCHILSFCNGEEKKKKVKRPLPVMPTRRVYHKGRPTRDPKRTTLKPKKLVKKSIPKAQIKIRPVSISRTNIKRQDNKKTNPPNKLITTRRPQTKRIYKKSVRSRSTTSKPKKRHIQKRIHKSTTNKPLDSIETEVTKIINAKSENDQAVIGQKIVKRVMSTVQKMIEKEISKISNTKRVQRSIGNKDCLKGKRKDQKKSHHNKKNEKQKKSKKQNRQIKRNLPRRIKREARDIDLSMIDIKDDSDAVIIMPNKSLNVTLLPKTIAKTMTEPELPRDLNTTLDFVKYKYSINASSSTEPTSEEGEITKSNLVINHTESNSAAITTDTYAIKAKDFTLIITDPNFNDPNYKKWEEMEMRSNQSTITEKSDFQDDLLQKKSHDKYIERKDEITTNNIFKQITPLKYNSTTTEKNKNDNGVNIHKNKYAADGNLRSFQSILRNLLNNSNSTVPSKMKQESNLFRYLRSMFKKIFDKKKNLNLKKTYRSKELQTLEILCENIGACFMNKHNRVVLRSKLHDLNTETDNIFRLLKIIKGLLRLIEIPYSNIGNLNENSLNDEIQKLNTILKGAYAENSLTETQKAQITYVKENVHQFVRSISRFASILNEIFDVLYKNNKKYGCQRKLHPSQKKKKQNSFNKIKNLLVKYNIVQNTFMKNMYKLLTEMGKNKTAYKPKIKASVTEMNNTQIIDTYSKSIIENLRRLKDLAQTLNSNRSKRQIGRENYATEYFLMLMEYLLKQNQPSDSPVNDGIDLLVEAIENAPDVRFIRKKVLDDTSTTETTAHDTNMDSGNMDSEDNISDNKVSKEVFQSKDDKQFAIVEKDNEEETTQIVYYKKNYEYKNNTLNYNEYETTENPLIRNTIAKTDFDKFESTNDDTRRYEVFSSDDDDISIITTTNRNEPTTVTVKEESNTYIALQHYRFDDEDTNNTYNKKDTMNWIEENFSHEIKDHVSENNLESATSPMATTVFPSTIPTTDNIATTESLDNTSGMIGERTETVEEFLRKKQQDFLNYLDYGTESSDSESESKDKFPDDSFPSYFLR